jgi:hypothetical protein
MSKAGGRELSSSPFAPDGRGINGEGAIDRLLVQDSAPGTQRELHSQFRSATANSIASRLLPSIQERLTCLAKAFEQEYEAKVEEQVEIERVLRKRTGELEYLRRQLEDLTPTEDELNAISPDEESRQDAQLVSLEREAEAWLEMEQAAELRSLVAMAPPPSALNGSTPTDPAELSTKLNAVQDERRKLVTTIVSSMGNAGMGERQEGYKRLIRGAIGVRESEIEGMLDEVLRELEEEARERGGYGEGGATLVGAA